MYAHIAIKSLDVEPAFYFQLSSSYIFLLAQIFERGVDHVTIQGSLRL
jgi:hypothetical protein